MGLVSRKVLDTLAASFSGASERVADADLVS